MKIERERGRERGRGEKESRQQSKDLLVMLREFYGTWLRLELRFEIALRAQHGEWRMENEGIQIGDFRFY